MRDLLLRPHELITAFCQHYGIESRERLAELMRDRTTISNVEFDDYFATRPQNALTLREWYRMSTTMRYHFLHCAVWQLASWAPWFWQQVDKLGAKSLVDIGCGLSALCGPLAAPLAEQGGGVILADLGEEHRRWLAELYPAAMVIDVDELWATDLQADLVTCTEVFEHVPEPEALLAQCLAKVRPGGYLATSWSFCGHTSNHRHLAQHDGMDAQADVFGDVIRRHGLACVANRGDGLRIWQRTE